MGRVLSVAPSIGSVNPSPIPLERCALRPGAPKVEECKAEHKTAKTQKSLIKPNRDCSNSP
jgi:hypothetical protein